MKRLFLPALVALVAAAISFSCSGNRVKVLAFTPTGEVQEFTTFQVDFDQDLAPVEKQGEWSDEAYMTFDPPVKGKFKWMTGSSLIFSPDEPLLPSEDYKVTISDKILFGKTDVKQPADEYTFHTPYFDATGVEFFWTHIPRSQFKVTVQANINFNYLVDPTEILNHLYVEKGGEQVKNIQVESKDAATVVAINFGEMQQTEKEQEFLIRVKKGLKSTVAKKALSEDREFNSKLAPITRLAVTGVSSGYDGEKGWIEVFTTQAIDHEVLSKYLTVSPKTTYNISTTENSFRLEGGFTAGNVYDIAVKKGLPGLYGGTMENEYTQQVPMADMEPDLYFTDKEGQYLLRGGQHNVEITAVNISKVDVKVYQVFENNIVHYLSSRGKRMYQSWCCGARGGQSHSEEGDYESDEYYDDEYYYDDYYYEDYYSTGDITQYGKLVYKDTLDFGEYKNRFQKINVNLGEYLDARFKGIYVVDIRSEEDYWRKDQKMVSVSDLGIITKRSRDEMLVFVNSISAAKPVEGVDISLVSHNNQTLLTGKTDANGIVHFKETTKGIEDFMPRLITAHKGDDFNYVDFVQTELGLSRFDVGGKTEYSDLYDTYIYADRNLFRPGETANVVGILRSKEITPVKDLPVKFKVISPQGKTFAEIRKTSDAEGAVETQIAFPDFAETGEYSVDLMSGDDNLLATYTISVEEFQPDKIRVKAEGDKKKIGINEPLKVSVFAEYLFGTPCADHNWEMDVRLNHSIFSSKKYPKHNFSPSKVSQDYVSNDFEESTLDENGKATAEYVLAEEVSTPGYLDGTAYVTVFDNTGRTVSRTVDFEVYPNDWFAGIHSGKYYTGLNEAIPFTFVAVNKDDKDIGSFRATVELIRYEWRTVLQKGSDDQYRYRSEYQAISVSKKDITINGETKENFSVDRSGSYEVRLSKKGEEKYVSRSFYAYGSSSATASSFPVDKEGKIEIVLDKQNYKPGETAKVLFTTPFSGRMLVTVERENVIEHKFLDVTNNSASMDLPVTAAHLPNVFVSATIFRPHTADQTTPFLVGHGYAAMKVDEPANKINVSIDAPDKIKPRTTQEIVVKTGAGENVYVTFALVDEGILQIKNYKTPDPYGYMYARRKLSVSHYDLYEQLLPEIMGSSHVGGDGEMARNLNPVKAERFKLLSYWSGMRRSNSAGEVRVKVPIPHFNGEARLMAVAFTGNKFGSAEKPMKISDDVVITPAIPRFFAPSDSILIPITMMNTTDKSGKVDVTLKTEGPLKVVSSKTQSVSIPPKGTGKAMFAIKADAAAGKAKITMEASGMEKFSDITEISVRPTSALVTEDGSGMIKGGESKTLNFSAGFMPSTQKSAVTISKFPAVKMAKQLRELVGYPHGCVEQTTSKLFPQLYFDELAKAVAPDLIPNGNPVYFVKEGIAKLQSMQQGDGSFSYWPGGGYSSDWGSVFATHFLVEARKAKYEVPDKVMNKALEYIAREAASTRTEKYEYWRNNAWVQELRAPKSTVYALYVLAVAGKGDVSLMNYYRSRPHLLTSDTRYMLAGAFGQMNQWNAFKELIPAAFTPETPRRETGGSFDSEIRSNAILLSVLVDTDPNHKQIPQIVTHLSKIVKDAYSTQDKCWAFLALGKAAKKTANANVTVDVLVDGKSIGTFTGTTLTISNTSMNGKSVTLKSSGTGEVYYAHVAEGVKITGDVAETDSPNLKARRKFYSRDGRQITDNTFEQGDLVVVEITVTTGIRSVDNVAVTDLIPAGFDIDNPRLGSSTSLAWVKQNLYPDYLDIRDDRIVLYNRFSANSETRYYYMCRATNAGRFRLAALAAECMYDPDYKSYNGAGWVTITPKNNGAL